MMSYIYQQRNNSDNENKMFVTVKIIEQFKLKNVEKCFWVNRCQLKENLLRLVLSNQQDILQGFNYDCVAKKIEHISTI